MDTLDRKSRAALIITILCVGLLILLAYLLPVNPTNRRTESEPEQTVINLVYAYQNSQWNACVEEVVRRFELEHPEIDIRYELRFEDMVYEDMLNKLAARDELGDIVQLKEPYIWAESGLIAPLPEGLSSAVDTRCVVDGQTYAVCALGATSGVVYNKTLFDRYSLSVPETYSDFLALCETLKQNGITPLGLGGKDLWHFEYWMNHFLRSDVLSAQPDFLALCSAGERDWNDPLITKMLSHLNDLFRLGYVDGAWPSTPDSALSFHLAEQKVAMVFSGPWLVTAVSSLDPDAELGWFYVPNEAGLVVAGDSLDVFWAVTAGCARDEARYAAATAFLEYFYSSDIYEDTYTAMAGASTLFDPGRDQLSDDPAMADIWTAHDEADRCFSAYIGDENTPPGFEKKLLTLLSRMCAGELTVEETQSLAQYYWDECLKQEVAYAN